MKSKKLLFSTLIQVSRTDYFNADAGTRN